MKKQLALLMAATLTVASLAGCSSNGGGTNGTEGNTETKSTEAESIDKGDEAISDGATIEYAVNYQQDAQAEVMQEICDDFEKETGIHVELTLSGADHESVMKTRMASGSLPDLWNTHGWSVQRYSEYLEPLNEEAWYGDIDDAIKGTVEDEDGNIYVLPMGEGVNGIIYNADVLNDNGIDATTLTDVDKFSEACQTLVDAGITPMVISNADKTNNAHFLGSYLAAYLTCSDLDTNYGEDLLDGTFDWQNAKPAFENLADWWNNGYFNVDAISANRDSNFQAVASGEAAFMFFTNDGLNALRDLNPDVNLGVMPMPATEEGGLMTWGVSEGNNSCVGIWKDTEHMDECKQFLGYLAQPEVAERVVTEIEGGIPALKTLNIDGSYSIEVIRAGQDAFEGKVDYVRYFDQAYLPSGMWGILKESASAFFEGEGGTEANIENALDILQTNYDDMYDGN